MTFIVPDFQDFIRNSVGFLRNFGRIKFCICSHSIVPSIGFGVQTRQHHHKRRGIIAVAALCMAFSKHQIQTCCQPFSACWKYYLTVLICFATVGCRDVISQDISFQRRSQCLPGIVGFPGDIHVKHLKLLCRLQFTVCIHCRNKIDAENRAGQRRSVILIRNCETNILVQVNTTRSKRGNRQKHENQE